MRMLGHHKLYGRRRQACAGHRFDALALQVDPRDWSNQAAANLLRVASVANSGEQIEWTS
jgi:hypothetical protein